MKGDKCRACSQTDHFSTSYLHFGADALWRKISHEHFGADAPAGTKKNGHNPAPDRDLLAELYPWLDFHGSSQAVPLNHQPKLKVISAIRQAEESAPILE